MAQAEDKIILQTAHYSVVVSLVLLITKFWAYRITGSQAVYSDAMESIVNVVAAIFAVTMLKEAQHPADKNHPYGHGKLESFSAAFEGGLIAFASVVVIYQAGESLVHPHEIFPMDLGFYLVLAAGMVNLILGLFILRRAKMLHSNALHGSGKHILSDVWTTVGTAAALVIVYLTGWLWIDSIASLLLGIWLGHTGIQIIRKNASVLIDEEDRDLLNKLRNSFEKNRENWVIQIHHTRIIRSGRFHHIDSHVVVPQFLDVLDAHERVDTFEQAVIRDYPLDGEIAFHMDPCRKAYCRVCNIDNCPIRVEDFKDRIPVMLEHLQSPVEPREFRKIRRK
jgi:cation diffusion facilitator family transporter